MTKTLVEILPVLRCPKSHSPLTIEDGKLISQAGDKYPIVNGKPILLQIIQEINLQEPKNDIISKNIHEYQPPEFLTGPERLFLHLGSGDVPCYDRRVISLDILPCQNADVVGEAEELPFIDRCFDYVESGAVFEHLFNPIKAIQEIRRVLKPGGQFRIDTAFLQMYHGYPGHYFNMTPQAVETFLVDDFILEQSVVPDSATPIKTIIDILDRFLYYQPLDRRVDLLSGSLDDFISKLKADTTKSNPLLSMFSEFQLRSIAASFVVRARKPENYEYVVDKRVREGHYAYEKWLALKRNYYSKRMGLMKIYQEVSDYITFCEDKKINTTHIRKPDPIEIILQRSTTQSMLEPEYIRKAILLLEEEEKLLFNLRDQYLHVYTGFVPENIRNNLHLIPAFVKKSLRKILK